MTDKSAPLRQNAIQIAAAVEQAKRLGAPTDNKDAANKKQQRSAAAAAPTETKEK